MEVVCNSASAPQKFFFVGRTIGSLAKERISSLGAACHELDLLRQTAGGSRRKAARSTTKAKPGRFIRCSPYELRRAANRGRLHNPCREQPASQWTPLFELVDSDPKDKYDWSASHDLTCEELKGATRKRRKNSSSGSIEPELFSRAAKLPSRIRQEHPKPPDSTSRDGNKSNPNSPVKGRVARQAPTLCRSKSLDDLERCREQAFTRTEIDVMSQQISRLHVG